MAHKLLATNGGKTINLLQSDDPDIWTYFGGRQMGDSELYSRVAAAFTAVNKKARAVASVPFAIMRGDEEIDNSGGWRNVIGFLPNPRDTIRRVMQSLIMSNAAYLRLGKTVLGTPKKLNFITESSIDIITDPISGNLVSLNRMVGGQIEKAYKPDDPELVRFWWLDNTTELLPAESTQFKAIMNAAGILYYADIFTKFYFQRGGIRPTLIAMKGLVAQDKKEDVQRDWSAWVRGVGQAVKSWVSAKIFNAEAMDIQPFGDGLGDLKETPVFQRALEDIAIGLNIPMSLLLANSANYATAEVEYRAFFRDEAVPWFDFIADTLNEWEVFKKLGYRMENRAEVADSEQEEEVARQAAAIGFGDVFMKYPSYDLLVSSLAGIFGYELPDDFLTAAKKYYADKESPPTVQPEREETRQEEPAPKAWLPTIDQLEEMRIWREVALRRFRRAESLDFEYEPHKGGLPADVTKSIYDALVKADSVTAIKAAFDMDRLGAISAAVTATQPVQDDEIVLLANALNRVAEAIGKEEKPNTTEGEQSA